MHQPSPEVTDQVLVPLLLLRCLLLTRNCSAFALSRTAVGTGTLTTNRQALTMTQTAVAGNIQQPFNIHLDFRTQSAFYLELIRNDITD